MCFTPCESGLARLKYLYTSWLHGIWDVWTFWHDVLDCLHYDICNHRCLLGSLSLGNSERQEDSRSDILRSPANSERKRGNTRSGQNTMLLLRQSLRRKSRSVHTAARAGRLFSFKMRDWRVHMALKGQVHSNRIAKAKDAPIAVAIPLMLTADVWTRLDYLTYGCSHGLSSSILHELV